MIVLLKLNLWLVILPGFFEAILGGGLISLFGQVAAILTDICRPDNEENNKSAKKIQSIDRELWILFTVFDGIASLSISAGSPIGGNYNRMFILLICLI
nr:unnamed protein product [Trichobilharzia regenti]